MLIRHQVFLRTITIDSRQCRRIELRRALMGIYGGKSGHDRDSNSSICSNSSDDCSDEGGEPSKRGGGGKEGKEGMDGVVVYQHEAGSIQYSPHLTSPHKNKKADLKAKSGKKGKGGKKGRKKGRKSGQVVLVGNHYRNLESFNQSTERKGGGVDGGSEEEGGEGDSTLYKLLTGVRTRMKVHQESLLEYA